MKETAKQKEARSKRAEKQIKAYGHASLKNRKSPEEIDKAMVLSNGNTKVLCKLLDCTFDELMVLLSSSKELGVRWKNLKKCIVAEAEDTMLKLLSSQDEEMRFKTSKYLLDHLGQQDGYGAMPQVAQQINVNDNTIDIRTVFGLDKE